MARLSCTASPAEAPPATRTPQCERGPVARRLRRLAIGALLAGALPAGAAAAEVAHLTYDFTAADRLPGTLDGLARGHRGLELSGIGSDPATGSYDSGPLPALMPFTAVGPHWRADVPNGVSLSVELSTSADGVSFGPFHTLPPDPHSAPAERTPDGELNPFFGDTVGSLLHRSRGDGRWFRLRVRLERQRGAARAPALARLTLTFIDSREPDPAARFGGGRPEPPPASPTDYPKPPVHSRSEWGARPPACDASYCAVTHIGVHHTAGVAEYACAGFIECAADVRAIQAFHMDVNGWCDLGYNYLASADGELWEGRGGGDDVVGAHDGHNCGSMGVANMGYYHPPYNHLWTEPQIDAVSELGAWKCDQQGIDPFGAGWYAGYGGVMDNVYGHRDVGATACPGDTIYPRLGELRSRIDAKLSGGGGGGDDEIVLDNPAAALFGDWTIGFTAPDKYGPDYLWTSTGTEERRGCRFTAALPADGRWDVSFWWSAGGNRNPATRVGVRQGVMRTFTVNQQLNGGRWNSVGTLFLGAGTVELGVLNDGEPGRVVVCDAVRLARVQ